VGVNSAQYQLSLYNMTAPISGVVEAVNLTLNNFAASGTVAFVISNGSNKTVTFYVTDQVRQTLTAGQEVSVVSDGRTYQGAVTEISGVVDAATGLFKVKAVINEAQSLPDGLAVELTTTAYRSSGAILIPSDAVYFDEGNAYVYVAQDGTVVRTEVTVGLYTADTIAVTSGLTAGDEVITTWSAGLKDGAPIRHIGCLRQCRRRDGGAVIHETDSIDPAPAHLGDPDDPGRGGVRLGLPDRDAPGVYA
jgi:RND family efflux transporter MFP subunit